MTEKPNLDEDAVFKSDVAYTLFTDVAPLPEPQTHPVPVAKIAYSGEFDFVMSVLRGLEAHPAENFREPATASPRLLLLLAFAVRLSSANYTCWKRRRDVVLCPQRFVKSARESLRVILPRTPAPPLAPPPPPDAERVVRTFADLTDAERACVTQWCPSAEQDMLPCGSPGVGATYSIWRAVRWELVTTKWFCFRFQKNFQVWHHRKELIQTAINRSSSSGDGGSPEQACGSFKSTTGVVDGVHFSEIDERPLCNAVLDCDAKNYHVWSHRAWFLNAFREILLEPGALFTTNVTATPTPLVQRALAILSNVPSAPPTAWPAAAVALVPELDRWCVPRLDRNTLVASHCCDAAERGAALGGALQTELDYTAQLLRSDIFNNSAWSHRMALVKGWVQHHLVHGAMAAASSGAAPSSGDVLKGVLLAELLFVLSALDYEPCNESPYTYGIAICEVYATNVVALLRDDEARPPLLCQLELHAALLGALTTVVTKRVAEVRAWMTENGETAPDPSAADAPSPASRTFRPTIYLQQNLHQCDAARYHCLARMVGRLGPQSRPSQPQDEKKEGSNPALLALLRSDARDLCVGLALDDSIRAKYWRFEFDRMGE